MTETCFALFDTEIGACAIAWRGDVVVGLSLPETTPDATRARMARRAPDARQAEPPPAIREAIEAIVALLRGDKRDLSFVALDMAGVDDFNRDVYALARRIPPGATRTYGDIARDLGDVALSRAVGQALGANPFPIVVPCHRVLGANGKTGGFSARGGVDTKFRMLNIEKAGRGGEGMLFEELPLMRKS